LGMTRKRLFKRQSFLVYTQTVDRGIGLGYTDVRILTFILPIKNMPERTPAFEAYLESLKKSEKSAPVKGKVAKEGKLAVALDELSSDEETAELDAFAPKKLADEDQEA